MHTVEGPPGQLEANVAFQLRKIEHQESLNYPCNFDKFPQPLVESPLIGGALK